jgi:hypothetical protein
MFGEGYGRAGGSARRPGEAVHPPLNPPPVGSPRVPLTPPSAASGGCLPAPPFITPLPAFRSPFLDFGGFARFVVFRSGVRVSLSGKGGFGGRPHPVRPVRPVRSRLRPPTAPTPSGGKFSAPEPTATLAKPAFGAFGHSGAVGPKIRQRGYWLRPFGVDATPAARTGGPKLRRRRAQKSPPFGGAGLTSAPSPSLSPNHYAADCC